VTKTVTTKMIPEHRRMTIATHKKVTVHKIFGIPVFVTTNRTIPSL